MVQHVNIKNLSQFTQCCYIYALTKCFTSFLTDSIHLEKSLNFSSADERFTLIFTFSFISSDKSVLQKNTQIT